MQGLMTLTCLTDLTTLSFHYVKVPDDALQSIAACTQLRSLDLYITGLWTPGDKSHDSVMKLTQLTGLTALAIHGGKDDSGRSMHHNLVCLCHQLLQPA